MFVDLSPCQPDDVTILFVERAFTDHVVALTRPAAAETCWQACLENGEEAEKPVSI